MAFSFFFSVYRKRWGVGAGRLRLLVSITTHETSYRCNLASGGTFLPRAEYFVI